MLALSVQPGSSLADGEVERGRAYAEKNCGRCHATGADPRERRSDFVKASLGGRRDTEFERHGEFRVPKTRRGAKPRRARSSRRQTATEAFTKSLLRSLGSAIGGVIGGMLGGKRRRRRRR